MKLNHLFLFALLLGLISCDVQSAGNQSSTTGEASAPYIPTESEKELLTEIGFETEILNTVRTFTDSAVFRMETKFEYYDSETKKVITEGKAHNGLSFHADMSEARLMVFELMDEFRKKGYFIYVSETHFGYEPDEVSILKTNDQFDILRAERTDGINYDLENKDVIEQLEKWNETTPFQITGASLDYVEAEFVQLPTDMDAFAAEVYAFCPDVVDQGSGSVSALAAEMKDSQTLYLWWD